MKKLLVTIAPGFEEIETIKIVDILRRAGARVTIATTVSGVIEGSRCIKIVPDDMLENVMDKEFDLIFLPGGQPGTENLKNDLRIVRILQKMQDKRKISAQFGPHQQYYKKQALLKIGLLHATLRLNLNLIRIEL